MATHPCFGNEALYRQLPIDVEGFPLTSRSIASVIAGLSLAPVSRVKSASEFRTLVSLKLLTQDRHVLLVTTNHWFRQVWLLTCEFIALLGLLNAVRVLILILVISVGLILLAPTILNSLKLEPEPVSAIASAVAAVVGAIAAYAAFLAARESSSSARDSARAVALALKPTVRVAMKPGEKDGTGWMTVELEILSQQPVRKGLLRWSLRDGTRGFADVPLIEARTSPFGAMIHNPERLTSYTVGAFDDSMAGIDRVSFEYSGASDAVRWKLTQEVTCVVFEIGSGPVHERNGEWVPSPQMKGREQYEVEL